MNRPSFQNQQPALAGNIEFAFAFVSWMQSRRTPAKPSDLMNRFGMSQATAYRYLRRYRDAFCQEERDGAPH
jgi:predicted DNA-binding transcriptional regulator YafY